MKIDAFDEVVIMKRSVKEINFGGLEEKKKAAMEIKRLAKGDDKTRRALAELGVIRPLVAMAVESEVDACKASAVEALVALANGSFRNKKLIVEAGLLKKLPRLVHNQSLISSHQFTRLLFSISSLAKTPFPLSSFHILPFLLKILDSKETDDETKLTCLSTLRNLSTKLENVRHISTPNTVQALLTLSLNKAVSEQALATLSNLIATTIGKKAIEDDPLVPKIFIDVLTWDDKPKCQELSVYLLMTIAHKCIKERQKMLSLGIVPVLLELALLGSSLARKRALKLLEWLKHEGDKRIGVHSGPQARRLEILSSCVDEEEIEENKRNVTKLVKQSLDKNMELIMRRAKGAEGCSSVKVLVATSSSKSLPY